jgi:hypothetical protein
MVGCLISMFEILHLTNKNVSMAKLYEWSVNVRKNIILIKNSPGRELKKISSRPWLNSGSCTLRVAQVKIEI